MVRRARLLNRGIFQSNLDSSEVQPSLRDSICNPRILALLALLVGCLMYGLKPVPDQGASSQADLSWTVRIWSAATDSSFCTTPLGQEISTSRTFFEDPNPK